MAFSHEGWELTSRVDNYAVGGVDTSIRMYAYGTVNSKVSLVKTDRQTPGYMRSPPETPYIFPLESAIDELAHQLKIDPVELRRKNDTKVDPISGKPYTSRSLMTCYDVAGKAFGWSSRAQRPGAMRDGEWLVGWGCATAVYPTKVGAAAARVKFAADGGVIVQCASHEIGTGVRTVAGQMAAELIGVDFSAVQVEMGDTEFPPAPPAGGSNSTARVCSTVLKACEGIRAKIFEAAVKTADGPLSRRPVSDLDLKDGKIVAKDGASQDMKDFFKKTGFGAFEEYAEFIPDGAPPSAVQSLYAGRSTLVGGSKSKKLMYAFGAEFVEVKINARTREIRVPRMVGAFAGGRIMNTRTARSQIMGGMIWGMSSALFEETQVDERNARYINREFQDYQSRSMPTPSMWRSSWFPRSITRSTRPALKGSANLATLAPMRLSPTPSFMRRANAFDTSQFGWRTFSTVSPTRCGSESRRIGWDARIRTWEWRNQNPLPYHLATSQSRLERPALRATAERHNSQSMMPGQWRAAMRAEGTVERCIRVSRPHFCYTNATAFLPLREEPAWCLRERVGVAITPVPWRPLSRAPGWYKPKFRLFGRAERSAAW